MNDVKDDKTTTITDGTIIGDINTARANVNTSNTSSNILDSLVNAIRNIFDKTDIEQKSRKTAKMIFASTKMRTENDIYYRKLNIKNHVKESMCNRIETEVIGFKGLGRADLIEITRNLQSKIEEQNKLLSLNRTVQIK